MGGSGRGHGKARTASPAKRMAQPMSGMRRISILDTYLYGWIGGPQRSREEKDKETTTMTATKQRRRASERGWRRVLGIDGGETTRTWKKHAEDVQYASCAFLFGLLACALADGLEGPRNEAGEGEDVEERGVVGYEHDGLGQGRKILCAHGDRGAAEP